MNCANAWLWAAVLEAVVVCHISPIFYRACRKAGYLFYEHYLYRNSQHEDPKDLAACVPCCTVSFEV